MNTFAVRVLAVFISTIALSMSAIAAIDRGGTLADKILMVSISVAICAGSQFLLAISRRKLAWILWVCCLFGTLYSHLVFFSYSTIRAQSNRAQHSVQVTAIDRQIEAAREALSGINARPVATVATELSITNGWRKRRALEAELAESKRAVVLRDEIVKLSSNGSQMVVTLNTDLVTSRIARITGSNEDVVTLVVGISFAAILEFIGSFLWCEVIRNGSNHSSQCHLPQANQVELGELGEAIKAGLIKPTVKAIRSYLSCSQAKAMQVRRDIVNGS